MRPLYFGKLDDGSRLGSLGDDEVLSLAMDSESELVATLSARLVRALDAAELLQTSVDHLERELAND